MSESGLKAVGLSLIVLPDDIAEKSESGIILGTPEQLEREQLKQTDGIVVDIGPIAWFDESSPRCKIGDRVIMAAYAGMIRKGKDGRSYRIIKDSDVIGIIEEEDNE